MYTYIHINIIAIGSCLNMSTDLASRISRGSEFQGTIALTIKEYPYI